MTNEQKELNILNHKPFEYSYQECLACGNCKEIVEDVPKYLKLYCTQFLGLTLEKIAKCTIPCSQFKPKQQEPTMTENKMEWDVVTPGKLIGKEVSLDGCKCVVIGDKRLLPQIKDEACFIVAKPLNPTSWSVKYCVKPDEISPWLEPEVLEERAQFLFSSANISRVSADTSTKEQAEIWCNQNGYTLQKFPVGQVYKFNKNGELVE